MAGAKSGLHEVGWEQIGFHDKDFSYDIMSFIREYKIVLLLFFRSESTRGRMLIYQKFFFFADNSSRAGGIFFEFQRGYRGKSHL